MKKALWLIALFIGFSFSNIKAQDVQDNETTVQVESQDDMEVDVSTEKEREHSKAGRALRETGSAVGSAAKWTGKELGRAAMWTGKKVGKGASWTWDKAKHNKLTKNLFNQPGNNEGLHPEVQDEAKETNVEVEVEKD